MTSQGTEEISSRMATMEKNRGHTATNQPRVEAVRRGPRTVGCPSVSPGVLGTSPGALAGAPNSGR